MAHLLNNQEGANVVNEADGRAVTCPGFQKNIHGKFMNGSLFSEAFKLTDPEILEHDDMKSFDKFQCSDYMSLPNNYAVIKQVNVNPDHDKLTVQWLDALGMLGDSDSSDELLWFSIKFLSGCHETRIKDSSLKNLSESDPAAHPTHMFPSKLTYSDPSLSPWLPSAAWKPMLL
ncbi:hypothetical protein Dimus_001308 [Dionaea muscipula]